MLANTIIRFKATTSPARVQQNSYPFYPKFYSMSSLPQLDNILKNLGIDRCNPMQIAVQKAVLKEQKIVLNAPTGSGKTLGFLLPLFQQIDLSKKACIQAIVICPTRELCLQIKEVVDQTQLAFKSYCCYGGHPIKSELSNLTNPPTLLIGTPGRIADHLRRESIQLDTCTTLVLDEFDKSLELGFTKEMSFILGFLTALQLRMLTSATNMDSIPEFVGMADAHHLDFIKDSASKQLQIKAVVGSKEDKEKHLIQLTRQLCHDPLLIFCNQRTIVEQMGDLLFNKGFFFDIFHGGLEQSAREIALFKFKNGSNNILITTDLAARGIDISSIRNIIHYQLPHSEAEFIHRNGRTARMHATGTAYILLEEDKPWRDFLNEEVDYIELEETSIDPFQPEWCTIYLSAGKKDKISKFDIVGTLYKKVGLNKEDIGLIQVKENRSYVCIKKTALDKTIEILDKNKIKKKKIKVALAN